MHHIKKIRQGFMISMQVLSFVLSVGSAAGVAVLYSKFHSLTLAPITQQIAGTSDEAGPGTELTLSGPVTSSSVATSTPTVTDSAAVRAMIVDEYNQYIIDTKAYLNTAYPESSYIQAVNQGSTSAMTFATSRYSDIQTKTSNFILAFCDVNPKIDTESDREYCHNEFDIKNVRTSLGI